MIASIKKIIYRKTVDVLFLQKIKKIKIQVRENSISCLSLSR